MKMRMMTDSEWNQLVELTEGVDSRMHWIEMYSWINDGLRRTGRGGCSPNGQCCAEASARSIDLGFRPVVEGLPAACLASLSVGDPVCLGTLYMGTKRVHVPTDPTMHGSILSYVTGAQLEMRDPWADSRYQVKGIYLGNGVAVADRNLLKMISFEDIEQALGIESQRPVIKAPEQQGPTISSLIKTLTRYQKQYGDLPVSFFSDEWTDDLEEMQYQQRWLNTTRKVGSELRIMLDH